ncbi:MAG: hypothetical protein HDR88_04080 [Bacteroides sp.]|nr:hypothetical protein [Bacteroides sp.]
MSIIEVIKRDYNSFLTAIVIFLYGLANIAAKGHFTQIAIVILSACVVTPSLLKHIVILNIKMILIFISGLIILISQLFLYPENSIGIIATITSFCSIGFIGLYSGSLYFNIRNVLYFSKNLAYLNFFINLIYICLASDDIDTLSMRFGYGILPSALYFFLDYCINKSKVSLSLAILISCLIFIWGSRGCLLVIALFWIVYGCKKHPLKTFIYIGLILLCSSFLISNLSSLIDILPVESYKLRKMSMTLNEGLIAASSGRDVLYEFYWNKFMTNLWGFGAGCMYQFDMNYPHNLFIQIAVEFGVIGLILLCFYIIYVWRVIFRQHGNLAFYMIMIFALTFGRLLVSSNFWDRPEFWFLMSLVFTNPTLKNRKKIITC